MLTLYKYFIYAFIFLSDTMSDWNSFKSVKHLLLLVIVRWPMLICSPELNALDWPNVLCINNNNVNLSFDLFYENVNKLILKHAPLKKLTTQEKKLCLKPWITTGILTSIKTKNRIYRKFLCTKNATTKQQLHNHFKYYWNNLTKITKASKALHYKEFFEDNKGNLRKTWEGSREIINISKKKETDDKWYIWQKFSTRWSTSYIRTFQQSVL